MTAVANDNDRPRPKFLNLLQIHLPITGVVSIVHRISGVLLVFGIPLVIYLLQLSMQGPEGFDQLAGMFSRLPVRSGLLLGGVMVAYHLIAGVRFLLIDLGVGEHVTGARRSAWSVLGASAAVLLIALAVAL